MNKISWLCIYAENPLYWDMSSSPKTGYELIIKRAVIKSKTECNAYTLLINNNLSASIANEFISLNLFTLLVKNW